MTVRRWPWLLIAALMLVASGALARAVYLYWLPCRGSMLSGSVLRGYAYGPDFTDACLRRMDEDGPFPNPVASGVGTGWAAGAAALLGLTWLVLPLTHRWSIRTRVVAALPGLATLAMSGALSAAALSPALGLAARRVDWLWLILELLAVVALVAVWAWEPAMRGRPFRRLVVVAYGTTALGLGHEIGDYLTMINWSDANWDVPPGTGYPTAAAIAVAAILTVVASGSRPPGFAGRLCAGRRAAPRSGPAGSRVRTC